MDHDKFQGIHVCTSMVALEFRTAQRPSATCGVGHPHSGRCISRGEGGQRPTIYRPGQVLIVDPGMSF